MDDDHLDQPTEAFDIRSGRSGAPDDDPDDPWGEFGARRAPRQAAEGVRIIGADEAAAAIESGQVAAKKPEDELRFGDVPPPPSGPRPSLRFPGADPSAVDKPPVADPRPSRADRDAAAAEAARRWDAALARSAESRSRASRSSSPLFGDDDDDDLFGYRSPSSASVPPPPPPGAPTRADLPDPPRVDIDAGTGWLADGDDYGDFGAPAPPGPPPPPLAADPGSGSVPLQHWTEPPSGEVPRILVDDDDLEAPSGELSAWSSLSARPRWRDQPTDWEEADFTEDILADEHRMGALRAPADNSAPFSFDEPETDYAEPPPPASPPRPGRPSSGRTRISSMPTGGPVAGLPPPPGARDGGGSDLTTRVVTGAIAAGVLLVALVIGPGALVFLIAVALTMAVAELYQGLRSQGYHPATLLGLVGTASLVGAVYWRGLEAYPLVIGLFVVFTMLWYLAGVVRARPTMNVAVTVLAFLYIGFLGSFAAAILKVYDPVTDKDLGVGILVGAIIATVANDVGAYFVGRWAGKTPLAPAISPNKTVEGMVGACLATLLVCLVIVRAIDPWDGGTAFWLAVVVCVAAPLGDLVESMIKRDLNVKDMGALLPGHGGVIDRIDGLLFVAPATFYLMRLVIF